MLQLKNKTLLLFLLSSSFLKSAYLGEINEIKKLSNYEELKNIEVERVVDWDNIERNKSKDKVYVLGETEPFTGSAIKGLKNKKNVEGILFYRNGHSEKEVYEYYPNNQLKIKISQKNDKNEGKGLEYYSNGKLQSDRFYKDDIMILCNEYRQNGTLSSTYKATDGLNGIKTVYYENGKDVKTVIEITQDYSQKGRINDILNGKLKAYDKQGNVVFNSSEKPLLIQDVVRLGNQSEVTKIYGHKVGILAQQEFTMSGGNFGAYQELIPGLKVGMNNSAQYLCVNSSEIDGGYYGDSYPAKPWNDIYPSMIIVDLSNI